MEPSEPTTWERRLLERFSETACVEDRAALALQLANPSIRRRTNEYVDLEVPESLRVGSAAGYPVDAWYPDDDGTPVFMILHLVERQGSYRRSNDIEPTVHRSRISNPTLGSCRS